jgi:hypothetical protein
LKALRRELRRQLKTLKKMAEKRKTKNITKQGKNLRMQETRLKQAQKQLQTKSKILIRI